MKEADRWEYETAGENVKHTHNINFDPDAKFDEISKRSFSFYYILFQKEIDVLVTITNKASIMKLQNI